MKRFNKKHIEEDNPFLSRMDGYLTRALEVCSKEARPIIIQFFENLKNTKIEWNGKFPSWEIERISEAGMYLAKNTAGAYKEMESAEKEAFLKLFDILYALQAECLKEQTEENEKILKNKISLFSEMFCKNMVGKMNDFEQENYDDKIGMIFQNYADLYEIIHEIDSNYEDLVKRGFNLYVFYDFWDYFQHINQLNHKEDEASKVALFKGILNGTKKLHPVKIVRTLCYDIVDIDFEGEITYFQKGIKDQGYSLNKKENTDANR